VIFQIAPILLILLFWLGGFLFFGKRDITPAFVAAKERQVKEEGEGKKTADF
jgi:hypothetical protein